MRSVVKTVQNADENVVELKNRITEPEVLVKYYEDQFRLAKHLQFGVSSEKSEYDFGQLCLFNEAEIFARPEAEPDLVEIEKHYRKRTHLTTDKLPDDLLVEVVEHTLPEAE